MTVSKCFYNWQNPTKADYVKFRKASPNLVELCDWLVKRFGGMKIGLFQKRPIRGGTQPSSHSFGAALDWRYPSRERAKKAMRFLVKYSDELGVQAIHDYVGGTIWRAGRGWKAQKPDGHGMGQPWATWLHIEVCRPKWGDARPVVLKVGEGNLP